MLEAKTRQNSNDKQRLISIDSDIGQFPWGFFRLEMSRKEGILGWAMYVYRMSMKAPPPVTPPKFHDKGGSPIGFELACLRSSTKGKYN